MNAPSVVSLAQRIEQQIEDDARRAVEAAMQRARDQAFRAYADALSGLCGHELALIVADAMQDAERVLSEAAIRSLIRQRNDAVLRQLRSATA